MIRPDYKITDNRCLTRAQADAWFAYLNSIGAGKRTEFWLYQLGRRANVQVPCEAPEMFDPGYRASHASLFPKAS